MAEGPVARAAAPAASDGGNTDADSDAAETVPPAATRRERAILAVSVLGGAALVANEALGVAVGVQPGREVRVVLGLAALTAFLLTFRKTVARHFAGRTARFRLAVNGAMMLALGILLVAFYAFRDQPPPKPLHVMRGTEDIAVVGFSGSEGVDDRTLTGLSHTLSLQLADALPGREIRDYASEVDAPLADLDRGGEAAAKWTERFAADSGAEIVLGGTVARNAAGHSSVLPAVYVRAEQVPDAPELAGWYVSEVPAITDQGLDTTAGREAVVSEIVRAAGTLADLVDAVGLWSAGRVADADKKLHDLLDDRSRNEGDERPAGPELVHTDLVRIFAGHAAQQLALSGPAEVQQKGLDRARDLYGAVAMDSPLRPRATLNLANNEYLRSVGQLCRPGTVAADGLTRSSEALRRLSEDPAFTATGRAMALVNLARSEQCRVTATVAPDDGTIDAAIASVQSIHALPGPPKVLNRLKARATAIAAQRLGDPTQAEAVMRTALDREGLRFDDRALWLGHIGNWRLQRCDLTGAEQAHAEALDQLARAVDSGQADKSMLTAWGKAFSERFAAERDRCERRVR